ncbi:hypothetical protein KR038_009924 [Drosophila bunnanda]|nr:hypothetical protein KR038_009924 [Drosophila bunnanda]
MVLMEQGEMVVQPKLEEERLVAPKRSYRPHFLTPSAIRRICHLPAEKCNSKTEAKVMYLNSNFGKCSLFVCHEDICPYTGVCRMHKEKKKPKPSIVMRKHLSRIAKKSARNSAIPKRGISKKYTKSPDSY